MISYAIVKNYLQKYLKGIKTESYAHNINLERKTNVRMKEKSQGTELFDQPHYIEINEARLNNIEWMKLELTGKSVLDVGCGTGYFVQSFIEKGCKVVCLDGREKNIEELKSQYPDIEAHVMNVEKEPLSRYGVYDVVFCYGLLYHVANPVASLFNIASACKEILMLETMICDHPLPVMRIVEESQSATQALNGIGCRPSPMFIISILRYVGFPFIYAPKILPDHPQFKFEWKGNLDWSRNGHPLRNVFVASKRKLCNPRLIDIVN